MDADCTGTAVAESTFMRLYPRAGRTQLRIGNMLPDVSGEIETEQVQLADGTGAYAVFVVEISEEPTERYACDPARPSSRARTAGACRRST